MLSYMGIIKRVFIVALNGKQKGRFIGVAI
jgi:hypothetical protein